MCTGCAFTGQTLDKDWTLTGQRLEQARRERALRLQKDYKLTTLRLQKDDTTGVLAALLLLWGDEADGPALGLGWGHELADRVEDDLELAIVFGFQRIESAGEVFVGGKGLAKLHEGAHHVQAHLDRAGGVEDGSSHERAVLGEGVGRKARVAVALGTGRKLRPVQRLHFSRRELEHEIFRKAFPVTPDLLVQPLGGHAIERGEVGVDHDLVAADDENALGDARSGQECERLVLLGDGDTPSQAGC